MKFEKIGALKSSSFQKGTAFYVLLFRASQEWIFEPLLYFKSLT
jgi:hypothetical protein